MLCCIITTLVLILTYFIAKCRGWFGKTPANPLPSAEKFGSRTRIYQVPFAVLPNGDAAVGVHSGVILADMTYTYNDGSGAESCDLCPNCIVCPNCPQCKVTNV